MVPVQAEFATGVWHAVRALFDKTGYWPVLVQSESVLDDLLHELEYAPVGENFAQYVEATVQKGLALDFATWVKAREDDPHDNDELMGEWPEDPEPAHVLVQLIDLRVDDEGRFNMEQLQEVILLMVPVKEPWHLPAALKLGGWNACPKSHEHVCAFKYWYDNFGAEPSFVSRDTFEFIVNSPPGDRESSLALAIDQYFYCYDLVAQGCGSILELAGNLVDSTVWYFWWD